MDIEKRVRDVLASVAECPVLFEVPAKRPPAFATLDLVDDASGVGGIFHEARMLACCWGPTRADARALADSVADAVFVLQDSDGIMGAKALSVYRDPDPDTGSPRYTVSLQIKYSV